MKRFNAVSILLAACAMFAPALPAGTSAQAKMQATPEVIAEDHHDTSLPLSVLTQLTSSGQRQTQSGVTLPRRRTGPPIIGSEPDPVVQKQLPSGSAVIPTSNFLAFAGISNRDGLVPPDSNAAIGNSQIFEVVNVSYQIFNTTGGSLLGPAEISTLWNGFGGQCDPTAAGSHFYSDPVVLRDKPAKRWLVTVIGSSNQFFSSNDVECIAVSTGTDATGTYNRYSFTFGSNLNDYPKFGVWPDAYYASYNIFANASTFIGAQACAYNRTAMLAGNPATAVCFQRSTSDASFLPSDFDGIHLPPSGEPNFFLELGTSTTLKLFRFHVDFTTPPNSTFTGPINITVASYSEACGGFGACIPQSGTSVQLDSLGDRLMHSLSYRNFQDHESLVANHSVAAGSSVGVRWYEIRSPNSTPVVFQQGTFAPDSSFRWMGSINMNGNADICLGYSVSSASIFPGIRFTGRLPTDPHGTMQAESTIINGGGAQTGTSRWGDYTSMATDPADNLTFVYTNEVYRSTSSFGWSTEIASFQLQ